MSSSSSSSPENSTIANALGLPSSSDLAYVKRMFHRRCSPRDAMSSNNHGTTTSLNTLRLDTACIQYMTEHFRSTTKDPMVPRELVWKKSSIIQDDDQDDENDGGSFEQALSELVQTLEPSLNTIRILDRSSGFRMLGLKDIAVLFRSFAKAQNVAHVELHALEMAPDEPSGPSDIAIGGAFTTMLSSMATQLTSLTLSLCSMDKVVLQSFAQVLPRLTQLNLLHLEHCVLVTEDESSRGDLHGLVPAMVHSSASTLVIQNCGLQLAHVTEILDQKSNLELLDLSHDHDSTLFQWSDTDESIRPFAAALAKAPSLYELQLECCKELNNAVVEAIFGALQQNPRVQELNLKSGTFTTLDYWFTSLKKHAGTGLVTLSVPHNLRKRPAVAAILSALKQNTTLCHIYGSGRWRRPGAQIQRLLTRNQSIRLVRNNQALLNEKTALWPLVLTKLLSNTPPNSETGTCSDAEMSPVYLFLLMGCANL